MNRVSKTQIWGVTAGNLRNICCAARLFEFWRKMHFAHFFYYWTISTVISCFKNKTIFKVIWSKWRQQWEQNLHKNLHINIFAQSRITFCGANHRRFLRKPDFQGLLKIIKSSFLRTWILVFSTLINSRVDISLALVIKHNHKLSN